MGQAIKQLIELIDPAKIIDFINVMVKMILVFMLVGLVLFFIGDSLGCVLGRVSVFLGNLLGKFWVFMPNTYLAMLVMLAYYLGKKFIVLVRKFM